MGIRIYNTLSKQKEDFVPGDSNRVTLYACGPTVYNYAHIGNARPAVVFDLLRRVLERHYPEVVYARNITDVDDKINTSAAEEGVTIDVISSRYTRAYHDDMGALGVGQPSVEPRATEHIPQMIDMIERLIASGHAYEAEGHVLFAIETYDDYGALSRRDMEDMVAGARVEVAPYKKHPGDFVLWKPSVEPQPGWDSPWGWGRPGWHLECSVMAAEHLAETIDIHGGGQDLVFPHHENEIAQSACAHNAPLARYWMHNGFLTMDREKMSKSLGNIHTVHDLLEEYRGETLRYVLLSAQYRKPLDWSDAAIAQAQRTLDRMYAVLRDAAEKAGPLSSSGQPGDALLAALDDDLNTPDALAEMNGLARRLGSASETDEIRALAGELLADGELMGLLQNDPEAWFKGEEPGDDDAAIDALVAARDQARADRDFARADELRDQLTDMGIVLEDGAGGTRWRRER